MSTPINETQGVRDGEELDITGLRVYLETQLPEAVGSIEVEQFPHGHSNLTYLIRLGGKEWVLRRPPFGNRVKTAHDMGREYRILSRLSQVYGLAPTPALYCDDETVIGAPFYLMEPRTGIILRGNPDPMAANLVTRLCETLVDGMASLHAIDYRAAGLQDLGKPEGYVARQVSGWTKRYHDARTDLDADVERTAAWLAENQPASSSGPTLIHNDFKFDNLVLDPGDLTRIVAVLDWEMATIGDPLMDLGTTLAYWTEPGDPPALHRFIVGPTTRPGSFSRQQLVDRYGQTTGRDTTQMLFYYVCGLFKVAVIAQQIYARYVRGLTHDARFGGFQHVVSALGSGAVRAIDSGRI
jgi:aminoglycoside phosphotransferase (APT) family kinase protein